MVIFSLFSRGILVILGILVLLLFIGSRGRIVFSSAYYAPNNPKEPIKLVFTREPMGGSRLEEKVFWGRCNVL